MNNANFDGKATKLFIQDFKSCNKKFDRFWEFELKYQTQSLTSQAPKTILINMVLIQGIVEETERNENNIDTLIVNDNTGKVKVTQCASVPGDNSWLTKGVYCSVLGYLMKESGLAEVSAVKLINLSSNPVYAAMWPLEVEELHLLYTGEAMPDVHGEEKSHLVHLT